MLRQIIAGIVIILSLAFMAQPALAHLIGQPPYFMANGQYASFYKILSASISDFPLAQDQAPQDYLVNQPIHFELDINKLPAPPEIVKQTRFDWDFGDGTKAQGLKTDHTYTKMGTYVITIYAKDNTTPEPQLLETVQLNILPDKDYKLPQPIIKVNGQQNPDPINQATEMNFNQPFTLDGSSSTAGTAKIVSYLWDLGDQSSSTDQTLTHTYSPNQPQIFPLLRLKDENGFISDSFVQIKHNPNIQNDKINISPATPKESFNYLPFLVLGILVIGGVGGFLIWSKLTH